METLKKDINQEWKMNIKGKGMQKPKSPAGAYVTEDPNKKGNSKEGTGTGSCGHCGKQGHKEDNHILGTAPRVACFCNHSAAK